MKYSSLAVLAVSAFSIFGIRVAHAQAPIFFRTVACELQTPSSAEDVVQHFEVYLNIEQFGQPTQDGMLTGEILAPAGSPASTLGLGLLASFTADSNLKFSAEIEVTSGVTYGLKIELAPPVAEDQLALGTATITNGTNVTDYKCVGYSP